MSFAISPLVTKYKLDSEELATLLRATIDSGYTASFHAPGSSMIPFIRSGDKIFVSPVEEKSIRSGDVLVFLCAPDNRVIAHRVIEIANNRFLCKGDNLAEYNDGWISFEDILGRVERVQRDGKPVRLGVKSGKRMIAWLSRKNWLVLIINTLRRLKWGIISLFSPGHKSKS